MTISNNVIDSIYDHYDEWKHLGLRCDEKKKSELGTSQFDVKYGAKVRIDMVHVDCGCPWDPENATSKKLKRTAERKSKAPLECNNCKQKEWVNSEQFKALNSEYDPGMNEGTVLSDLSPGSGRRIKWLCANKHEWDEPLNERTNWKKIKEGKPIKRCQECKKESYARLTDALYADILEWYCPTNEINAMDVKIASTATKYKWVCSHENQCLEKNGEPYQFEMSARSAVKHIRSFDDQLIDGHTCNSHPGEVPYSKSVAYLYPEIAEEFYAPEGSIEKEQTKGRHNTVTGRVKLNMSNISPSSSMDFEWECPTCGKHWNATPYERCTRKVNGVLNTTGCPNCSVLSRFEGTGQPQFLEFIKEIKEAGRDSLLGFDDAEIIVMLNAHPNTHSQILTSMDQGKITPGQVLDLDYDSVAELKTSLRDTEEANKRTKQHEKDGTEESPNPKNGSYEEDSGGVPQSDDVEESGDPITGGDLLEPYTFITDPTLEKIDISKEHASNDCIQYLVNNGVQKFWKSIICSSLSDVEKEIDTIKKHPCDRTLFNLIRQEVLYYYSEMLSLEKSWEEELKMPPGFIPEWYQRFAPLKLKKIEGLILASYAGSGKTEAGIFSIPYIDSECTLVITTNNVLTQWEERIKKYIPSADISVKPIDEDTKYWEPGWNPDSRRKLLVINFEQFSSSKTMRNIQNFLSKYDPKLIILDEEQLIKEDKAERSKSLSTLIDQCRYKQSHKGEPFYVLAMSGDVVVNDTGDAHAILDVVRKEKYSKYYQYGDIFDEQHELKTVTSLEKSRGIINASATHVQLTRHGVINPDLKPRPINDAVDLELTNEEYERIISHDPNSLNRAYESTPKKLDEIIGTLSAEPGHGTIIKSTFVNGPGEGIESLIVKLIKDKRPDLKVGTFSGNDKTDLALAKKGLLNVLVASDSIKIGIDGLQHHFDTLVFNDLPHTYADFNQTVNRLNRPGQKNKVKVKIPLLYYKLEQKKKVYKVLIDKKVIHRLQQKRVLGDFAVYGITDSFRDRLLSTDESFIHMIQKLDSPGDKIEVIMRPIPQYNHIESDDVNNRKTSGNVLRDSRFNDFTKTFESKNSAETQRYLQQNPEKLRLYLSELDTRIRTAWQIDPLQHFMNELPKRSGINIADFGAGNGLLSERLGNKHTIFSFDHVKHNERITQCNISERVPLDDGTVEYCVFCLSLWDNDLTKMILEANRVLDSNGILYIYESKKRLITGDDGQANVTPLIQSIDRLGFKAVSSFIGHKPQWIYLKAMKITDVSNLGDLTDVDPLIGFRKRKPNNRIDSSDSHDEEHQDE